MGNVLMHPRAADRHERDILRMAFEKLVNDQGKIARGHGLTLGELEIMVLECAALAGDDANGCCDPLHTYTNRVVDKIVAARRGGEREEGDGE